MTLTEFLLARIGDDQKWARQRRDEDFRKHRVSARRPHLAPDDAERVLAECTAHRRIVERCAPYLDPFSSETDRACTAEAELAEDMLRVVASVYAAHPDYREEWRP